MRTLNQFGKVWYEVKEETWVSFLPDACIIPFLWNEKPPNHKLHAEEHNQNVADAFSEGLERANL